MMNLFGKSGRSVPGHAAFAGIGAAAKPKGDDDDAKKGDDDMTAEERDAAEKERKAAEKEEKRKSRNKAAGRAEDDDGEDEDDDDGDKKKKKDGDDEDKDGDDDSDEEEMRGGKKSAVAMARSREKARIAAILSHPAAAANVEYAMHLALNTNYGRGACVSLLEKAPRASGGGTLGKRMEHMAGVTPGAGAAPASRADAAKSMMAAAFAKHAVTSEPKTA